jgi:Fe-S cluster biogenesis protein NfuA/nitrite reductase/ring-hydroxylating ferredoxin subunit
MATSADPADALIARVQELTDQLEEVHDFQARAIADELVASIMQLYGAGLERIMDALSDPRASAADVRARVVDDGVVASLLVIHDLYPVDLEARVRDALDSVRPYMESHGGDIEILGVEDGVARLQLVGHCRGCPASEATLELAIKAALEEHAPDLAGLEVDGVRSMPNGNGVGEEIPGWTDVALEWPPSGTTATMVVGSSELVVANVSGALLAYRNACGGCGGGLVGGNLTGGVLTCPFCNRAFDLRRAGRTEDDSAQIVPVPLLPSGGGRARVAIPA